MDAPSDAVITYARCYINIRFDNINTEEDEYANQNMITAVRDIYNLCEDMSDQMIFGQDNEPEEVHGLT